MRRAKTLAVMFVISVSSLVLLSACKKAEAPSHEPTEEATKSAATQTAAAAIEVKQPLSGDVIGSPTLVEGTASVFEGTVIVDVKDDKGKTLCSVVTQASEGAPGKGSFKANISFVPPAADMNGTIDAYNFSAKDGSVQNLVAVPVLVSKELPPIVVTSPVCGDTVTSPLHVEGTASVFEATLIVVVKDSLGNELARADVTASEGAPGRGSFSQDLAFSVSGGPQQGTVEAFATSPQDGSVILLFSVPVTLTP